MSKYWWILWFLKGVGHFQHKFQGAGGRPPTNFVVRKLRVPGLSRGVVCVILCLAVLIQYRRVTHRQTHTDGHTTMANTRAELAPCG